MPKGQQTTHVEGYRHGHRTRVQFPAAPLAGLQAIACNPLFLPKSGAGRGQSVAVIQQFSCVMNAYTDLYLRVVGSYASTGM